MRELKTIESEIYEKAEDGIHIRRVGMIKAQEAFDILENHLKEANLLPDEYFSLYFNAADKELPEFNTAVCHTDWGGSEGIYIDIDLVYRENNEIKMFHFATGKTLDSSGDAFIKMSRIAAECSMMLNGRGSIVRVSENNYEKISNIDSLDKKIAEVNKTNIKDAKNKDISLSNHGEYDL